MKFNAWELVCLEEALNAQVKGADPQSPYTRSVQSLIKRIQNEKPKKGGAK